ncbi:MAG TPA: iron-sulfur cluster repair di-iron protein [Thermoanaerobaculia bacterium]|nr:iron-sulfur cluster repair di-iron protein [Thermoanaerobaculia bacterium]
MNTNMKSIGELALETPHAIAVLERWKIDYCCNGKRSVAEACRDAGVTANELMREIGATPVVHDGRDWSAESLETLQQYIIGTHHVFTRQAMETVGILSEKVARRHGPGHPEVLRVRELVIALCNDLEPHMMKEEVVLFPYVAAMERGEEAANCFGTVRNPVRMMMMEHDAVGGLLRDLRVATNEYALPEDACLSFRALYERLVELELDLHKHIHLENNVHFPRAVELEDGQ